MDQPTVDGFNTFVVSRAARKANLTVALSGLGGDELFGGTQLSRRTMWVRPGASYLYTAASDAAQVLISRLGGRGAAKAMESSRGRRPR
jgi:asparagine synthase (glutamine-hydrolysing)